jgi:hypothetical protein
MTHAFHSGLEQLLYISCTRFLGNLLYTTTGIRIQSARLHSACSPHDFKRQKKSSVVFHNRGRDERLFFTEEIPYLYCLIFASMEEWFWWRA